MSPKNRFTLHSTMSREVARNAIRGILDINPRAADHIWGFAIGRLVLIIESFGQPSPTIWAWISDTSDGVTIYGLRRVSLTLRLATGLGSLAAVIYAIAVGNLSALGWLALLIPANLISRWTDRLWVGDSDRMMRKLAIAIEADLPVELLPPPPLLRRVTHLKRLTLADHQAGGDIQLIVNGDRLTIKPARDVLTKQFAQMEEDEFIILERDENIFIQILKQDGGFLVEHQAGGLKEHFRAFELLGYEDALIVLEHYLATADAHPDLDWQRITL